MEIAIPQKWHWFSEARFGLFIHWGPYAQHGRGEQVLMREMLDQREYAAAACAWNPRKFDAREWARFAKASGFRYAVLTTRHHDGFCLWDTKTTNYSSVAQSAGRDLVREFVEAFRAEGLRIGLYYSWNDFRLPALFEGPEKNPSGWAAVRDYVHAQVCELLTHYGRIDQFWFDGTWPRNRVEWDSAGLVKKMRALQPDILINNRLGEAPGSKAVDYMNASETGVHETALGDFGTPEHHIAASPGRLWESCQTSTWRLWGYCEGERWRPADLLLDMLTDAASQGGNLLLNVGPNADGEMPAPFVERMAAIGRWLERNGEAIYGAQPAGNLFESVTWGRASRRGNTVYLIVRFWPPDGKLRLAGLETIPAKALLMAESVSLISTKDATGMTLTGLPASAPDELFPVIQLEFESSPRCLPNYVPGLWNGEPERFLPWAKSCCGNV